MKMALQWSVLTAFIFFCSLPPAALAGEDGLEEVIAQVEKRYDVLGFSADFHQVSTIKAMEISDEATGRMFVRKPEMMRWEYDKPERQVIITNADKLWIYRPQDNQVTVGKAPAF
ncbi:MAG: outer membrane lipoprotein carrier protein LolA, partial [Desulfobacterales bacterium]